MCNVIILKYYSYLQSSGKNDIPAPLLNIKQVTIPTHSGLKLMSRRLNSIELNFVQPVTITIMNVCFYLSGLNTHSNLLLVKWAQLNEIDLLFYLSETTITISPITKNVIYVLKGIFFSLIYVPCQIGENLLFNWFASSSKKSKKPALGVTGELALISLCVLLKIALFSDKNHPKVTMFPDWSHIPKISLGIGI